ncbi:MULTISPECIES: DUF397 domain-containing protein [unclassified Streptomyces]|uniref:DUF397 domain-containing protein n=1 Tax=unclassified Streptomyces TaxID=2593676 RepID=UPI0034239743
MLMRHDMPTEWVKSSYSAVNGDCVEVRLPDRSIVAVRDSKNPRGPVLAVSTRMWSAFVSDVSQGRSHTS